MRDGKNVIICHYADVINVSDDMTKPLGYVLHSRHYCHLIGHCTLITSLLLESKKEVCCNLKITSIVPSNLITVANMFVIFH